jgi:hypothetical protein
LTPQEEIDDIVYKPASDDEEAMQVDKIEDVVKKPIAIKMQQTNTVKASHTLAMVFFPCLASLLLISLQTSISPSEN